MDVSKLVFRGDITDPSGHWYGKIEKDDGKKALVLFKRPEARNNAQHIADKLNDVHKGTKLAAEFIGNNSITLLGNLNNKDLLQRYLGSSVQNNLVLNNIAHLLTLLTPAPDGNVKFLAQLTPPPGGGLAKDISISWQPNNPE